VREGFVLVPMLVLIVVMGLLPGPFLAPAKPAVDRLVARFQQAEQRLGAGPQVGTVTPAIAVRAGAGAPAPTLPIVLPTGGAH
jgi:NADH-quinone oxidoreductase subunit M